MDKRIFHLLVITISMLAIILNGFGIYILQRQKKINKKQYIILNNLSALDITIASFNLLEYMLFFIPININFELRMHILRAIDVSLFLMYYQLIIFISLDRLVCVLLHMKYSYYVTTSRVKKIMIIFWMVSMCALIPSSLSDAGTIIHKFYIVFVYNI